MTTAIGIFIALGSASAQSDNSQLRSTFAQSDNSQPRSTFAQNPEGTLQTSILLQDSGTDGRYIVNASINGVSVKTYYTSENWFASLSSTTYLFLYENDYIAPADVKGFATLKMPDGSSEKAASFVIKELRIDNVILKDVPAFVLKKQTVPFLIGNSTFDGIGGAVQEGSRLIIGETTEEQNTEQASLEPEDSLKDAAQKHLDAKEYAQAASCFEALSKAGALNMFTSYEYSVVLNILERDDETIAVSEQWLSEYEGKSLTMDYWVYDCLGDAYARKKDVKPAIEKYQQAISAYCKLFNTTEKAIRKSSFQDETLGITLFNLSRMYASDGNVSKAEYYCSLAAKSGSQQAISFCKQYKIKY